MEGWRKISYRKSSVLKGPNRFWLKRKKKKTKTWSIRKCACVQYAVCSVHCGVFIIFFNPFVSLSIWCLSFGLILTQSAHKIWCKMVKTFHQHKWTTNRCYFMAFARFYQRSCLWHSILFTGSRKLIVVASKQYQSFMTTSDGWFDLRIRIFMKVKMRIQW